MAQTLAEYLMEQGERRGERRGETQAKREAVVKLIRLRFDSAPEAVASRIASIRSLSRLDALFESAATAQTLDDIDWED